MMMNFRSLAHLAGLTVGLLSCHNLFSHDEIWKGMHKVSCGTIVAWLVQIFAFRSNSLLGACLGVLGQMLGGIMPRMSCMFLKTKGHFEERSVIARLWIAGA